MTPIAPFEFPEEQREALTQAKRLAWLTIAYLTSVVVLLFLVLGSSQAMKAAWVEDLLSFIPPVAFLISCRVTKKRPNHDYPFGYLRATSVAYLCSSVALLSMGVYLLLDSLIKLALMEHPTIGTVDVFGRPIWLGFLMLPALVWSGVPVVFLGRAKQALAKALHDKVLYADGSMNKADWLTAAAAMTGILGIGLGLWWADAVAAALISVAIAHDGVKHLKASVGDLMDRVPKTVDYRRDHPLPRKLQDFLAHEDWVVDVQVRVREEGHVFFADARVVPTDGPQLLARIASATERALELDWRLHDLVVTPVVGTPAEDTDGTSPEGDRD